MNGFGFWWQLGSTAVGLRTNVLAVEKRVTSPLLVCSLKLPFSFEVLIGIVIHQNHRFPYGEPMTVESTTQAQCDFALRFGEGDEESMSRPFGVSLRIAGHDENRSSL
ncbi:hypothetical protein GW17_00004069 [Ensete ventricosum]|nr:hypothetical protein GW17_00004069 [Ensete ventricosum]